METKITVSSTITANEVEYLGVHLLDLKIIDL
jgi:hypothetical protein